jgi:hypothetical protein
MRRLALLSVILLGCTQMLGLDDAVVTPGEQTVSVPPFEATLVDGGAPEEDAEVPDASDLDAPADTLADTRHKPD